MSQENHRFYLRLLEKLDREGQAPLSIDLATGEKVPGLHPGWYQETLVRRPSAFLCGGGHVSAALAPLLHTMEWPVTVQDDRPEFVTPERFPTVEELICAPFSTLAERPFPPGTYFVIMTRGHQDDYTCLTALLKKRPGYLGMIGSRAKVAHTAQRLRQDGFSQADIDFVHSPVGLDIGAQTPAEIAVSIAAQIVQVFRSSPSQSGLERPVEEGLRHLKAPAVLATVLEKSGSSPRGAGTRMLVYPDGSIAGTIGGGALEAEVIREAAELMGKSESRIRDYALTQSGAAALGMVCGGRIRVLLEPLTPV